MSVQNVGATILWLNNPNGEKNKDEAGTQRVTNKSRLKQRVYIQGKRGGGDN